MTIVAYTPGFLGADSRAVPNPEEQGEFAVLTSQVRKKISLLANGRIAATNAGPILTEDNWGELEKILLHYCMILEEFEQDKSEIAFEPEHAEASVFRDRQMLVMTRRHIYLVSRRDGRSSSTPVGLMRVDSGECFAFGSGMNIAHVCFAAGMNCEQTIHFVIEQDMLTGPPVTVIEQTSLRPLIVQSKLRRKTKS